jgi:TonB family protein
VSLVRLSLALIAVGILAGQTAVQQGVQALRDRRADAAAESFRQAIAADPQDKVALAALGSLAVQAERWEEAATWYRRVLELDPGNKTAHLTMGAIAWLQWLPEYEEARSHSGLRPGWTALIPDPAVRARLRAAWWSVIDEGLSHLSQALALDADYRDAAVLLERLTRQRAEIRATDREFNEDVAAANNWADTLRAMQLRGILREYKFHPAVSPEAADRMLLEKPEPVYPDLARQARIQGRVRLEIVVGADGAVADLRVISGHPLLVGAAVTAVAGRRYRPLVMGGRNVEFATNVDVEFTLAGR